MKVEPRNYVSIHYTLTLDSGEQVDSTSGGDPLGFLQGTGQIIEGLDKAVIGKAVGEKFKIAIPPEEAYGLPNEEMYRNIPRENFPAEIELEAGQGFTANGPHGPVSFKVVRIEGDDVVADFNHALAGQTLHFDVEIAEIREPRAEELAQLAAASAHGHAHDHDGCGPDDCSSCKGSCGCN